MEPYYSNRLVTLYHGECKNVVEQIDLPKFDLLLTDPPYGINTDTDYTRFDSSKINGKNYKPMIGDNGESRYSFLFRYGHIQIIFGANNFPQQIPFDPLTCGWICWDKRGSEAADKILGSPFELAVVLGKRTYKFIRLLHCGVINADGNSASRVHPTQKPIKLFDEILCLFPDTKSLFDPFVGSGTTLIAAMKKDIKSVGIEIEEGYCEIVADRLRKMESEAVI